MIHIGRQRRNLVHLDRSLLLFQKRETVSIAEDDEALRFLLVCGKDQNEPVTRGGPIVMNTDEELKEAFDDYKNGTLITPA